MDSIIHLISHSIVYSIHNNKLYPNEPAAFFIISGIVRVSPVSAYISEYLPDTPSMEDHQTKRSSKMVMYNIDETEYVIWDERSRLNAILCLQIKKDDKPVLTKWNILSNAETGGIHVLKTCYHKIESNDRYSNYEVESMFNLMGIPTPDINDVVFFHYNGETEKKPFDKALLITKNQMGYHAFACMDRINCNSAFKAWFGPCKHCDQVPTILHEPAE